MLSTIRDKASGWIVWLIILLISATFALWGIGSYFEGEANQPVAEINGEEIDFDVYKQALDRERRASRQNKIASSLLNSPQFRRRVLDNIIERRLLLQDAEDQGYRIGNDQINEYIRSSSQFQRNGKFAQELYKRALRSAGYSPSGYEESLRQDNVLRQILNGFAQSIIITKKELERLARLQNQKRIFEYALISTKSFINKSSTSPEDVKAVYDSNASRYRVPEQVRVEYVRLSISELAKRVKVTKEQLKQAYESADRTGDSAPAFAAAEAKAKKLIKQLKGGADFEKLAKAHSADSSTANKGGDLGFQNRGSGALDPALEAAIFALQEGKISKPIRSAFGVHIIKLDKIDTAGEQRRARHILIEADYTKVKEKSFKEMRTELESDIRHKAANDQFLGQAEQFGDLSYEHPESLQSVINELGLKVEKSDWFSRKGGKGLASHPKIIKAAFSDEVIVDKQNSEVIELDADNLVVLRIDAHRESKLKPFKEVENSILARLRSTWARAETSKLGEQLVVKLNSGANWNEVLGQKKLSAQQPKPKALGRYDFSFKRPAILSRVFRMPRPTSKAQAYAGVALGQEGFALIRLKRVVDSTTGELDKDAVANARAVLQSRGGTEYFISYQKGLRDRADVIVHEKNL